MSVNATNEDYSVPIRGRAASKKMSTRNQFTERGAKGSKMKISAFPHDGCLRFEARLKSSMAEECDFVGVAPCDRDLYTRCQTQERALNTAIVQAKISESFEGYLGIFDTFYADDVEVSIENQQQLISGKAAVRSLLSGFLMPLHMMAEIGGLLVSVRQSSFPSDRADQTNSQWTVELVGVSGNTCTIGWRAIRKWKGPHVAFEHHYELQQTGGPLTLADLSLDPRSSMFGRPS